jgi:hypothetical protein
MSAKAELALVAVVVGALAAPAAAQHHHHQHDASPAGDAPAIEVALRLDSAAAEYAGQRYRFDTLAVGGALRWRAFTLGAVQPLHHFAGEDTTGLGDPHLDAGWRFLAGAHGELGVDLGVMLPAGDAGRGLGMGHAMIMPGVVAVGGDGPWHVAARLGYARALGSGHHHTTAWPLVSPMNGEQVELGAVLVRALPHHLSVGGTADVAIPIGEGDRLLDLAATASLALGRWSLGAQLGHGYVDHPLGLHGGVSIAAAL